MPDPREQALSFIRMNGPVLPIQIAKAINTNILFGSAILAELTARKQLFLTHAAIGGSKLYYLKGQETALIERLSKVYKGKEKEAYEFLRDAKVLHDKELEPWQRVAFKIIQDVALPISVTVNGQTELFWKYRLLSDQEVQQYLTHLLETHEPTHAIEEPAIVQQKEEQPIEQTQPLPQQIQPQAGVQPEPVPVQQAIPLQHQQETISSTLLQDAFASLKEELIKEMRPQLIQPEEKQLKKSKEDKPKELSPSEKRFYTRIIDYLKENNIEILKEEMIRKDKEFDFLIKIPTSLGPLLYYLKSLDKKVINEAELSITHSEGQLKKLPTIFLVTGKLNKKAAAFVDQKLQGQLLVKELA